MQISSIASAHSGRAAVFGAFRFTPADDAEGPSPPKISRFDQQTAPREDLPYKVELWDAAKTGIEQILAVTANASIGYAAYYAAAREYPDRYITLRHRNGVVSRSNPPER